MAGEMTMATRRWSFEKGNSTIHIIHEWLVQHRFRLEKYREIACHRSAFPSLW